MEEKEEKLEIRNCLFDPSMMSVSLKNGLKPGETAVLPVWIRGDKLGKHQFKFLFLYQSDVRFRSD
jgi:hypothetical protein